MIDTAANGGERALGYFPAFTGERELISHALLAEPRDANFYVDGVFKLHGAAVVAVGRDARPTDRPLLVAGEHAEAQVAEQFVLGLFHHGEEHRKVHDPGRVRIAKLDAAAGGERGGHGGKWIGEREMCR